MDMMAVLTVVSFVVGILGVSIAVYQTIVMKRQNDEMQSFTDVARDWGTDILEKLSSEAAWLGDLTGEIKKMDTIHWKTSQDSICNEVAQRHKAVQGLCDSINRYLHRTIKLAEQVRLGGKVEGSVKPLIALTVAPNSETSGARGEQ